MKKAVLILIMLFLLSFPASADFYDEQYDKSGAGELYENLPDDVKDFFDELSINPSDSRWINSIKTGNVFTMVFGIIKNDGKEPLITAASIIAVILLTAAFKTFSEKAETDTLMSYIATVSSAGAVLLPVYSIISATARSIRAGAQFMLSFVPIYATILTASGKVTTSAVSGSLLMAASEGIVQLSTYIITPISGAYLAVCLCGSVSPIINISGISELMKKAVNWSLGLIMTVYMGVLSIQTTVNSAADSLAIKTGKFMIGSFIPVVGAPISEALGTVGSCMSLLRSSVGIYGVIVLVLILLPTVVQLLLWRLSLILSSSVASMFECEKISSVLKSADSAVSFLVGILLICSLAFIISVTVLALSGG